MVLADRLPRSACAGAVPGSVGTGSPRLLVPRYVTSSWKSRPRRWKYSKNLTGMASYRIDEFWEAVQAIGFTPKLIRLLPSQKLNAGSRYAYYLLQKSPCLIADVLV
jgi:hypothetical protein